MTLEEREARIEAAQQSAYYEVGLELRAIRDNREYRERYQTFEDYCAERWERTPQTTNRVIAAASLAEKMEPIGSIPTSESHIRPLLSADLSDDERIEIWRSVLTNAGSPKGVKAAMVESAVARTVGLKAKDWITLDEWDQLDAGEQRAALSQTASTKQFNSQDNSSIEWAQWSWNPITGCRHDCPYCYARDIADRFYAQGFEPSIYPLRLSAPANTPISIKAAQDVSFKNVFTGSMTDLFGRWVPREWIEAVFQQVKAHPDWNFLFLTKFPQRMAEFDWPENAWPGTSVDLQARVPNAEKAFRNVSGGIKWLSIEPLIEPLSIDFSLFDWVVIGGASKSTKTDAWQPPRRWVIDLTNQAHKAGCVVYHKDNLNLERLKEFPVEGHGDVDVRQAPEEFQYLTRAKTSDQALEASA